MTGGSVPLSQLPSRCPDEPLRSHHRVDPYWAALWDVGSTAVWVSRSNAERMSSHGLGSARAREVARTVSEATSELAYGPRREARLRVLAAVGMWRTMTVQQVASVVGSASVTHRKSADRDVLWGSGLVQRGRFISGLPRARVPGLLRVCNTTSLQLLASMLSYRDLVGVTSGQPWQWGTQHDRHNLLATELMLRVAEHTPMAGVFGEQLGRVDLLLPGRVSAGSAASGRAADAVMVRGDGMRVAVEMTATTSSNFPAKIRRWVEALTGDRAGTLAVVFVEIPHPDKPDGADSTHKLEREIVAACSGMSAVLARVPQRIMVARWREWFPAYGRASEAFLSLSAYRPTGSGGAGARRWEQVAITDPTDLVFEHPGEDAKAVLSAMQLLFGVPYWLRGGPASAEAGAALQRAVLAEAGLDREPKRAPDLSKHGGVR